MANYVKLLATANRLIAKNGRDVVLKRFPRVPVDNTKPWRGPIEATEEFPDVTLSIRGVFVPPNTVREFGLTSLGEGSLMEDMIKTSHQIVIIPGQSTDIRDFNILTDRDQDWGIKAMQVLRPGDIALLAFIGVAR
jgi:hypothetical protein